MTEPDPLDKLQEMKDRIRQARGRAAVEPSQTPPSKVGIAWRFVTELVAAVLVGGGIGWGIDYLLGTSPAFLLLMLFVGIAGGVLNVIRAARQMNAADAARSNSPERD